MSLLPLRGFECPFNRAHEDTHRGEDIPVQHVVSQVHPMTCAQYAHAEAHGGEAVCAQFLPKCLQMETAAEKTLTREAHLRLVCCHSLKTARNCECCSEVQPYDSYNHSFVSSKV